MSIPDKQLNAMDRYIERGRNNLWATFIGAGFGKSAAWLLVASDPPRWLEYTPSATAAADAQFYTFVGGVLVAMAASYMLGKINSLLVVVTTWWTMFACLAVVKYVGMLLGIGR